MHVLFLLQTAFSIWMLVDAIRRGAAQYWYLIVLVPFGEVAYFIAVVLPDLQRSGSWKDWFSRPPTLAELQRAYGETPSHQNRLRLAQGLFDAAQIHEAGALFEEVLDADPVDRDALYGFARCALEAGEIEAGIGALETLVDLDMAYLDSAPAVDLVHAYWDADQRTKAIDLAETLCRKSQRIGPRTVLADYLIELGNDDEARKILQKGLAAYKSSPAYVQRRDSADARIAKAMLRNL